MISLTIRTCRPKIRLSKVNKIMCVRSIITYYYEFWSISFISWYSTSLFQCKGVHTHRNSWPRSWLIVKLCKQINLLKTYLFFKNFSHKSSSCHVLSSYVLLGRVKSAGVTEITTFERTLHSDYIRILLSLFFQRCKSPCLVYSIVLRGSIRELIYLF